MNDELQKLVTLGIADQEEINRIAAIQDLVEQGYETAPLMCRLFRITPDELLRQLDDLNHDDNIEFSLRDKGAIRWCHDNVTRH